LSNKILIHSARPPAISRDITLYTPVLANYPPSIKNECYFSEREIFPHFLSQRHLLANQKQNHPDVSSLIIAKDERPTIKEVNHALSGPIRFQKFSWCRMNPKTNRGFPCPGVHASKVVKVHPTSLKEPTTTTKIQSLEPSDSKSAKKSSEYFLMCVRGPP
jgi:hypothetical protein